MLITQHYDNDDRNFISKQSTNVDEDYGSSYDWDSEKSYSEGDVVRHEGKLWKALISISDLALRNTGPAGGHIFLTPAESGDGYYYEAAPVSTEFVNKQWGKYEELVGGTGTAIGTGKQNTSNIVAAIGETESDRAAQLCNDLSHNGFTDWFLPSRDELNQMYINLHQQGVGGFSDAGYWSSSEFSAGYSWVQYFNSGNQYQYNKDGARRVRAVRAF